MKNCYENYFNKSIKTFTDNDYFRINIFDKKFNSFLDIFNEQLLVIFNNENPFKILLIWDLYNTDLEKNNDVEIIIKNKKTEFFLNFNNTEQVNIIWNYLKNIKINLKKDYVSNNKFYKKMSKILNKDIIGINNYYTYINVLKSIEEKSSILKEKIEKTSKKFNLDELIKNNLNKNNMVYGFLNIIELKSKNKKKNEFNYEDYYLIKENLFLEKNKLNINKFDYFYIFIKNLKNKKDLPIDLDINKFYLFKIFENKLYKVLELKKLSNISPVYISKKLGYHNIIEYGNKVYLFSNKLIQNYLNLSNFFKFNLPSIKKKLFLKFYNFNNNININEDEILFNNNIFEFKTKIILFFTKFSKKIKDNNLKISKKVSYMNKTLDRIEEYFENICLFESNQMNINMLNCFINNSYKLIIDEFINPYLMNYIKESKCKTFFKFIKFVERLYNFYKLNLNTNNDQLKNILKKFKKYFYILAYNEFINQLNKKDLIYKEINNSENNLLNDLILFIQKYLKKYPKKTIKLSNKIIKNYWNLIKKELINNTNYDFSYFIKILNLLKNCLKKLIWIKKFLNKNTKLENKFNYYDLKAKLINDFCFICHYFNYEIEIFIKNYIFSLNFFDINLKNIINNIMDKLNNFKNFKNKYLRCNIYNNIFYQICFYYGFKIILNYDEDKNENYINKLNNDLDFLKNYFENKMSKMYYFFNLKLFEELINYFNNDNINIIIKSIININMWYDKCFNIDYIQVFINLKSSLKKVQNFILNYFNELIENSKQKTKNTKKFFIHPKIFFKIIFIYYESKYFNYKNLLNDINLLELSSLDIGNTNKFEGKFNICYINKFSENVQFENVLIILKKKKIEIKDFDNNLLNYYFLRNIIKLKRINNELMIIKTNEKSLYLKSDNYHNLNIFEYYFNVFYEEFDKFFKKEIFELELNQNIIFNIPIPDLKKKKFIYLNKSENIIKNQFEVNDYFEKQLENINSNVNTNKINILNIKDLRENNINKSSNISNSSIKNENINFKRRKTIELELSEDENEENKENKFQSIFDKNFISKNKNDTNNDFLNEFSVIDDDFNSEKLEKSVLEKLELFK